MANLVTCSINLYFIQLFFFFNFGYYVSSSSLSVLVRYFIKLMLTECWVAPWFFKTLSLCCWILTLFICCFRSIHYHRYGSYKPSVCKPQKRPHCKIRLIIAFRHLLCIPIHYFTSKFQYWKLAVTSECACLNCIAEKSSNI